MMPRADRVACSFWVQVRPVWSPWWPGSLRRLAVGRATQRKPTVVEPGCALIRVTLDLPEGMFIHPEAAVRIEVGSSLEVTPVTGQAEVAGDDPA
jgi:hypothetical protein